MFNAKHVLLVHIYKKLYRFVDVLNKVYTFIIVVKFIQMILSLWFFIIS